MLRCNAKVLLFEVFRTMSLYLPLSGRLFQIRQRPLYSAGYKLRKPIFGDSQSCNLVDQGCIFR
jgi:hypothetical protein